MKSTILMVLLLITIQLSYAQTWQPVAIPSSANLHDIDFPSNSVGYIVGDSATLLKTTDGGDNWQKITPNGIPNLQNLISVKFASEQIGFCNTGNAGNSYQTTDGGLNWTAINNPELGNLCFRHAFYIFNANHYLLAGAGCFQSAVIKEFENGQWSEQIDSLENFNPNEYVQEIDFYDSIGLAATNSHYFLRSTDSGEHWDTIPVPYNIELTSVVFKDSVTLFAGYNDLGSGFGLLRSNDAGLTWAWENNVATFFYPDYYAVHVSDSGRVYSGGNAGQFSSGGLIFTSNDSGGIWNHAQVDQPIRAIGSIANDVVYAVGDSGYVVRNRDLPNGLRRTAAPIELTLFPNPAAEQLRVQATEPVQMIAVLDASLRQISIALPANPSQAFELGIAGLPAGLYYLVLAGKDRTEVRKFVKSN